MVILTGKNWEIDVEPSNFGDTHSQTTCSDKHVPLSKLSKLLPP
jgi:hypothetical protein